ncbi:MAG: FxsA family protein [Phycisphaerae bacterium]|nr:FxsA family protein [Phycisphaerae bacterium]
MFGRLLLVFIAVPLVDLVILLRIGQFLRFWPTVGLVILTGVLGAALAKHQGLRTLARINAELSAGRMPTSQLADGLLILLAGAVLITPGFLTDLFGLLLLLGPFRRIFKRALARYFKTHIVVADASARPGAAPGEFDVPADVDPAAEQRPMKYVENEALHK